MKLETYKKNTLSALSNASRRENPPEKIIEIFIKQKFIQVRNTFSNVNISINLINILPRITMKRYLATSEASTSKKVKEDKASELLDTFQTNRLKAAESIVDFRFNKKRVKILTEVSRKVLLIVMKD